MNTVGVVLARGAMVDDVQRSVGVLSRAGILNVMVVGPRDEVADAVRFLRAPGASMTYKVEDEEDRGEAFSLLHSYGFVRDCCCVLPAGRFDGNAEPFVANFIKQGFAKEGDGKRSGARIALDEGAEGGLLAEADGEYAEVTSIGTGLPVRELYFLDDRAYGIVGKMEPDEDGRYGMDGVLRAYLELGELECDVVLKNIEG